MLIPMLQNLVRSSLHWASYFRVQWVSFVDTGSIFDIQRTVYRDIFL